MRERVQVELATGRLSVEVADAAFALESLCGFAARNNRKRGFLFLSKVLGKHWPARPSLMRQVHVYLASQLALGEGPWCFIAMAETATGLGQGVFEAVLDQHPGADALFVHSTRYRVADRPVLEFEESHCHAPDQLLYEPIDPEQRERFCTARELVVIDDEISTGSTLCHLVEAYRCRNPHLERVHFVTITDFSGPESERRFSERLGLPVSCVAALSASFSFESGEWPQVETPPSAVGENRCQPGQIAETLGRFGIDQAVSVPGADLAQLTEGLSAPAPLLVLGTGEFMHLAFRVGLALEAQGFEVAVQSTTRSPILIGADVERKLSFEDNYGEGITNYLYNVDPARYARIILCHETPPESVIELVEHLGPQCHSYPYRALADTSS